MMFCTLRRSFLTFALVCLLIAAGFGAEPAVAAVYHVTSSISLQLGSATMTVNGFSFPVDAGNPKVTPVVVAAWDRVVVPIRNIVEMTGGTVTWNAATRVTRLILGSDTVELTVGRGQARVNKQTVWIDENHAVTPIVLRGRTMIPVRFVAESLGGMANWNSQTGTIALTLPKQMIQVTDMAGHTVMVPRRVIRIATLSPIATQFVFSIGAQDQLVVASFGPAVKGKAMRLIYPRMNKTPSAGNQDTANIETLLAARPDIVLTEEGTSLAQMKAAGLPAYAFSAEKPGQLYDAIQRMGALTGRTSEATHAVSYLTTKMKYISDKLQSVDVSRRLKAYMAGSSIFKTFAGDFFQTFMISNAGGTSVAADLKGGKVSVSPEQVLAWNPDVIILTSYTADSLSSVLANPKIQDVTAVRTHRVYVMPSYVTSWDMPVPESFLGTMWLAQKLYPDQVKFDMKTEVSEFYKEFYHFTVPAADLADLSR